MKLFRFIAGIICTFAALIIGLFTKSSKRDYYGTKLNKRRKKYKYLAGYESDDECINKSTKCMGGDENDYIIHRMDNIISKNFHDTTGSSELKKKDPTGPQVWYKYKTWQELKKNKKDSINYFTDMAYSYDNFLFDWSKVLHTVTPYLKYSEESIGVIRAEPDRKTLYVYKMEKEKQLNNKGDYAAGISAELAEKYYNIPGYFIFHTHPPGGDPLPSDSDIYCSLLDCWDRNYLGNVVIGQYGIILYYLNAGRYRQLTESGSLLKYLTYCYELLSAWNSFTNSSGPVSDYDRIKILKKWGFEMDVFPSSEYIASIKRKLWLPRVITLDKFSETKYSLTNTIKERIIKLEKQEK